MKQILNSIRNEPDEVKVLASHMLLSACQGRDIASREELDDRQKQWLTDEGFTYSFNEKIQEWQILINETGDNQ